MTNKETLMDIKQMIVLALARNEQEYAETLLENFSDEKLVPVYSLPDYQKPAEIGDLWA